MIYGFRFENIMLGIETFRRSRNKPPSKGFERELRYPPTIFDGDSENRGPEADFGLPQIENSTFHFFAKMFAQAGFPSGSVCENCPGDLCARIAQGGF